MRGELQREVMRKQGFPAYGQGGGGEGRGYERIVFPGIGPCIDP